jgi:hypothetical protein
MTRAIAHSTTPLMDVIPLRGLMILQPCNGAEWRIITLALGAGLHGINVNAGGGGRDLPWLLILTGLQIVHCY